VFCIVDVLSFPGNEWFLLEKPNFEIANQVLKTPDHIAPVWDFTPFYAILARSAGQLVARPSRVWWRWVRDRGLLLVLPWLDRKALGTFDSLQGW